MQAAPNVHSYTGSELELFGSARVWKQYVRRIIGRYLLGHVLEVGAGLGGSTRAFHDGSTERWVCLEPDESLAAEIRNARDRSELRDCEVVCGTLAALEPTDCFDTVLYLDVLEHIEDHQVEVRRAIGHLRPGGHLVVLAPAHQWLYSPFDKAIGHFRRYRKQSLTRLIPGDCLQTVCLRYLDSVGLIASLSNRLLLKSSVPTARQIQIWDRGMVRLSRILDPLLGYRIGKSVLAVWKRSSRK